MTLPLSAAQQEQLLLETFLRLRLGRPLQWHRFAALEIHGPVAVDAIRKAVALVARRHVALRSIITAAPGLTSREVHEAARQTAVERWGLDRAPVRAVFAQQRDACRDAAVTIRETECRQPADARQVITELVRDEMLTAFDYARPPLVRAVVAQLGREHQLAVLTVPSVICDGTSMGIIASSLGACVRMVVSGEHDPELDRDDAAEVEEATIARDTIAASAIDAALSYWAGIWNEYARQQIALQDLPLSAPAILLLPDMPPSVPMLPLRPVTHDYLRTTSTTDEPVGRRVRDVAARCGVNLADLHLAVIALALKSHTYRCRFPIWIETANPTQPAKRAVGAFAHGHMVGFDLTVDRSGRDLVRQTGLQMRAAREHGHVAIQALWARRGNLERGVPVWFEYLEDAGDVTRVSTPAGEVRLTGHGVASWSGALRVTAHHTDHRVSFHGSYSRVFSGEAIDLLSASCRRILCELIADPDTPISTLTRTGCARLPAGEMSDVFAAVDGRGAGSSGGRAIRS